MEKVIKICCLISISLFPPFFPPLICQSIDIDLAKKQNLVSFGPIHSTVEITGYFLFFEVGKSERGNREYELRTFDLDLNQQSSKTLIRKKDFEIREVAGNDGHLLIRMYRRYTDSTYLVHLDPSGEILSTDGIKSHNYGENGRLQTIFWHKRKKKIYPLPGKGFLVYSTDARRSSKPEYIINFFSTNPEYKKWRHSTPTSEVKAAELIGVTGDTIFQIEYRRRTLIYTDPYIQGIDLRSGAFFMEQRLLTDALGLLPTTFTIDKPQNELTFTGFYYNNKQPQHPLTLDISSQYLGIYQTQLKPNGTLKKESFITLRSIRDVHKEYRKNQQDRLVLHHIIRLDSEKTYLIFEVINDGIGDNVKDLFIVTLDVDLNIIDHKVIQKPKRHMEGLNPLWDDVYFYKFRGGFYFSNIGSWVTNSNANYYQFGYHFGIINDQGNNFLLGYFYDGEEPEIPILDNLTGPWDQLGLITIKDEIITTSSINIDTKADEVFLLPCSFSKAALLEWHEKEKRYKFSVLLFEKQ